MPQRHSLATFFANLSRATPPTLLALLGLICLATTAFAAFMAVLALAGTTEFQIDPASGSVLRVRQGPLLCDRTNLPKAAFGTPSVVMRDSEDGPFPILQLPMDGWRRPFEMACFDSRAEAELWRDRIAAALAP